MGYKPLRQSPDVTPGIVRVGIIVGGHDLILDRDCAPVVHTVRKVVEMEEPVHEVTTHPELVEGDRWVTSTSQF